MGVIEMDIKIVICSDCCSSQFRAPESTVCAHCGARWHPQGVAFPMETVSELASHLLECGVPGDVLAFAVDHAVATYPRSRIGA